MLYLWLFGDHLWKLTSADEMLSPEHLRLEMLNVIHKERQRFKNLQRKAEGLEGEARRREPIPEDVRTYIWRRDEGKCVQCGSRENLEFDHIIPHSKGGSNSARNIQLLCEPCNRAKSANI
jgi:hypothetical protein